MTILLSFNSLLSIFLLIYLAILQKMSTIEYILITLLLFSHNTHRETPTNYTSSVSDLLPSCSLLTTLQVTH